MAEDNLQALEAALEALAVSVIVLDKDDLAAAGELLEKVEALLPAVEKLDDPALTELTAAFKRGVEKLIIDDLEAPDEFLAALPEAVSHLQDICRALTKSEGPGRLSPEFMDRFASLAGVEAEGEGAAGDSAAPEEQAKPAEAAAGDEDAAGESEAASNALPADLDVELASSFVGEALELLQEIEVAILAVEKDPGDPEAINAIFRPFHTIKGVSGFLNLSLINHLAHEGENLLDEAREGRLRLEGPVVDLILDAVDLLRVMIADVSVQLNTGQPTGEEFGVEEMVARIRAAKESGGAAAPAERVSVGEKTAAPAQPAAGQPRDAEQACAPPPDKAAAPSARGFVDQRAVQTQTAIKVDTTKLDNMVDMVGELVIALSLVTQNPKVIGIKDQKLDRDLGQLGRITSELQKTAMSLRMVPINQTFQRMVRLVRDLSRKSGKQVELIMEGQDTEIDRSMVEAIYDPLVHMVRNSMDHGLETAEERRAAGKPPKGRLLIRAYHQGGRICIEIEDDGRGLDAEKIFKKAVEKGVVNPEAQLTESEIHQLIMAPGFSTAEVVTDISGRGVGMDVVKTAVENLRGTVEIASELGKFTRFTIRLPLTMAIIEGMVVGLENERYIIPALAIEEVLRPNRQDYSTVSGGTGEMVNVRSRLLPLVRLGRIFGLRNIEPSLEQGVVVVVESEGQRKAIMVDKIIGKQEVVIKSLGAGLKDLKGLAGGAIMGDGRVGLILDVNGLFHIAENFVGPAVGGAAAWSEPRETEGEPEEEDDFWAQAEPGLEEAETPPAELELNGAVAAAADDEAPVEAKPSSAGIEAGASPVRDRADD